MRLLGLAVVLAVGLLAAPFAAEAEQTGKVPRVGYLNPGSASDPLRQRRLDAFREGLSALGYVEGQNIAVEHRWAEGKYERYPTLAAELVRSKVDVIVAQSGEATKAVQAATRTIPIVMSMVMDPVGSGIVPSLARPGANVTGTSFSPRLGREAVRTAQGGGAQGLSSGPPSASDQSGERRLFARGGSGRSNFGGAASNPGCAQCPGDRPCLRRDDQGA